jgi:hypothetical protein
VGSNLKANSVFINAKRPCILNISSPSSSLHALRFPIAGHRYLPFKHNYFTPKISNMKFAVVLPVVFAITMGANTVCARSVPECRIGKVSTQSRHANIVNNYLNLWKGDLSLVNQTFDPEITFNADRFPSSSGTGSAPLIITTSEGFGAFVNASRQGFETYGFDAFYWLGEGNRVAIRWRLDSIIGNYTRFPM